MAAAAPAAPAPASPAAPAIDVAHIQNVMMRVVAEKTGYPSGMLDLDMDMEADLGIDSIKRVEILGAVQEEVPGLSELNPEDLAELRSLGQIVSYMHSKVPEAAAALAGPGTAPATLPTALVDASGKASGAVIDVAYVQNVMMRVVAEKTGYPSGMLDLDMDMEADLGIDSIKRVEILGAVQEEIPGLPELNPEDLAELRTLGQIVSYMQSKAPGAHAAPRPSAPEAALENALPQPAGAAEAASAASAGAIAVERSPSAVVVVKRLGSVSRIEAPAPGARALLVDNGQSVSVELAGLLSAQGWELAVVTPSWVSAKSKKAFPKAVQRLQLRSLTEEGVSALIAEAGALDAVLYLHPQLAISGLEFPLASKQGLELAFLLAKLAKVKAATRARASFMVATWQGGRLGYQSDRDADLKTDLVQGGLSGLVKTLAQEWPEVFCRVVDLSAALSSERAAAILADELLDADMSLRELAYDEAGRSTLAAEATDSYSLPSGNSVNSESVFLVSGGAKGVTAACVARLAQTSSAKFILLGRSDHESKEPAWASGLENEAELKKAAMQSLIDAGEKPTPVKIAQLMAPVISKREIAASLALIEKAGGRVKYLSVDVTDSKKLKAALAPVIAEFGAVTGLIHGAGVLADKMIEQKTLADFEAVYCTKVDGLAAMLACVEPENLKHFVLFSSAAGFYGNPAQSDYSIANEILNKTALRFKALYPQAQSLSFNWGPWDGGMVTPELKRMFAARGVYIIPLAAGAELLAKELMATTNRSPQILVGNDMKGGSEQKKKLKAGRVIKALHLQNNPFLADHVIAGHSVLPTVAAMAWMTEAAKALYPGFGSASLESYQLFKGVILDGTQASSYALDLVLVAEEAEALTVDVRVSGEKGKKLPLVHYGARLHLQRRASASPHRTLPPPTAAGKDASIYYEDGTLFHGPSLRGLVRLLSCDDRGLVLSARIDPSVRAMQGEFPLEASNLFANDLVYQALLVWVREVLGMGSLPSSTGSWTVYREVTPGETFFLALSVISHDTTRLRADLDVVDSDGAVLAEVRAAEVTISATLKDTFKRP
ncbi:MAG: SDR family NAD(P)-dependent oxidoreductase [Spirochaetota bacterium]